MKPETKKKRKVAERARSICSGFTKVLPAILGQFTSFSGRKLTRRAFLAPRLLILGLGLHLGLGLGLQAAKVMHP